MKNIYHDRPIDILYWVHCVRKMNLNRWAEQLRYLYKDKLSYPLLDAVLIIELYNNKSLE